MTVERFRVLDNLLPIREDEWSAVTQHEPPLRLEVLRSWVNQQSPPEKIKVFLLEDDKGIAAAGFCQEVCRTTHYNPIDTVMFGRLRKTCNALHLSMGSYLSFVLPLGGSAAVCVRADSAEQQKRLLTDLMVGIENFASQHGLGTAFMRIEHHAAVHAVLQERGYVEIDCLAVTELTIEWKDLEGYIQHLRRSSKNAAKTVRNELRRSRRQGIRIYPVPNSKDNLLALYRLARDHYVHKNGVRPVYSADFFLQLADAVNEDLLILEARCEGRRTAMLGLLRSAEIAWAAWLGFEPGERPNDFTYFNLTFYAVADITPRLGITRLLYGNTVYDAKRRRGCRVLPCTSFYQPHNPHLRPVMNHLTRANRAWQRLKNA